MVPKVPQGGCLHFYGFFKQALTPKNVEAAWRTMSKSGNLKKNECPSLYFLLFPLVLRTRENNYENKMARKINLILHSEAYVNIYLSYDQHLFLCINK